MYTQMIEGETYVNIKVLKLRSNVLYFKYVITMIYLLILDFGFPLFVKIIIRRCLLSLNVSR